MASASNSTTPSCQSGQASAITYTSSTGKDICMVRNQAGSVPMQNLAVCCSTNGTAVETTTDGCWSYCDFSYDQAKWFQQCVGDANGQESLCIKAGGNATSVPVHNGSPSVGGFDSIQKPAMLGFLVFGLLFFSWSWSEVGRGYCVINIFGLAFSRIPWLYGYWFKGPTVLNNWSLGMWIYHVYTPVEAAKDMSW